MGKKSKNQSTKKVKEKAKDQITGQVDDKIDDQVGYEFSFNTKSSEPVVGGKQKDSADPATNQTDFPNIEPKSGNQSEDGKSEDGKSESIQKNRNETTRKSKGEDGRSCAGEVSNQDDALISDDDSKQGVIADEDELVTPSYSDDLYSRDDKKYHRFWVVPNILTILRLVALAPLGFFFFQGGHDNYLIALAIFILCALTDFLDGLFARILHQETKIGAWLDPAADRVLVFCLLLIFTVKGAIALPIFVLLISRDVLLTPMAMFVKFVRHQNSVTINYAGKIATASILFAIPLLFTTLFFDDIVVLPAQMAAWAFLSWAIVLYWVSGFYYFRYFWKIIKKGK